jgi:Bax protein
MIRIKTYIKLIIITLIITSAIVGGSFWYGTHNPNQKVIEDIEKEFHKKEVAEVIYLGLVQPEYDYNDKKSFITATGKCVDFLNFTTDRVNRVPTSMIIAMAGIESAWGTSRFATEGNALFGVRTWDMSTPHIKPLDLPDADFGVKKYETKCDSVKDMIRILNTHPAYEDFRTERAIQIENSKWDYKRLLKGITAWSTNPKYIDIIWSAIVDNNLP